MTPSDLPLPTNPPPATPAPHRLPAPPAGALHPNRIRLVSPAAVTAPTPGTKDARPLFAYVIYSNPSA